MSFKCALPISREIALLGARAPADGGGNGDETRLGDLPVWDLGDLYAGPEAAELEADLVAAAHDAETFAGEFKGRLADLDGAALGAALARYEAIDETLTRVMSYAGLTHAGDMADAKIGRFYQSMQERVTAITSGLLFFALEINLIEEDLLAEKIDNPALARYASWLRETRSFRPHQLAEDLEKLSHDLAITGGNAWVRLFDESLTALRFTVDGKQLSTEEVLDLLSDKDEAKRRAGGQELGRVLGENVRLFAHITNTLAKEKQTQDRWRTFATPVSSRNLANAVEDEVVAALVDAVRSAYPQLSHRYYAIKARWMGKDQLEYWDRNAPLPDQDNRIFTWDQARETVLGAYHRFSPDMAAVGKKFFDAPWIDAPVRPGKATGAFAHPSVPSVHPYLLLNYQGKTRDVMTLAHELGHGVHQVLAGGKQGHFGSQTPLTLAETASVFGEMLTFRALLDAAENPTQRRMMLAGKVEDMLNTVVRQIAFFEFETRVHDKRGDGELLPDELGEIWMDVQRESLGPALRFSDEYKYFWSYIPHFVHSPFYVYAYAFGDCLVNSLYAVYEQDDEGFAARYLEMLEAGGTLRHRELLAPFGLNAAEPDFWQRGLGLLASMIDELETEEG